MREQQDKDQPYVTDRLFTQLDAMEKDDPKNMVANFIKRFPGMGFIITLWRYNRQTRESEND